MIRKSAMLLAGGFLASNAAAAPDPAAGKIAFIACSACHGPDGAGGPIAPSLKGVVGRKAGATAFAYSPAMKASAITWTDARLNAFITSPQATVKGTRMFYSGQPDATKRANLIAYLKTLK